MTCCILFPSSFILNIFFLEDESWLGMMLTIFHSYHIIDYALCICSLLSTCLMSFDLQGLEKYVMTKLFNRVFASLPEDVQSDNELFEKIVLLQQFVRPENLDIKPAFQNETSWLVCVKYILTISFTVPTTFRHVEVHRYGLRASFPSGCHCYLSCWKCFHRILK